MPEQSRQPAKKDWVREFFPFLVVALPGAYARSADNLLVTLIIAALYAGVVYGLYRGALALARRGRVALAVIRMLGGLTGMIYLGWYVLQAVNLPTTKSGLLGVTLLSTGLGMVVAWVRHARRVGRWNVCPPAERGLITGGAGGAVALLLLSKDVGAGAFAWFGAAALVMTLCASMLLVLFALFGFSISGSVAANAPSAT